MKNPHDQLWNSLTDEERMEACRAIWTADDPLTRNGRPAILAALASVMGFRPKFLNAQTPDKKAKWMLARLRRPELYGYLQDLVRTWLLEFHAPVIQDFLDAAGMPRQGCFVLDDVPAPSAAALCSGIQAVLQHHDLRICAIYTALMCTQNNYWVALPEALEQASFDPFATLEHAQIPAQLPAEKAGAETPVEHSEQMTTLDHLLIRTIIASVSGAEGALRPEQAEHLVEEVVDLCADRYRSHFHRGFFQSLYGRPATYDFAAANDSRRAWYAYGYFMGLIRHGRSALCIAELKRNRALWRLLSSRDPVNACGPALLYHLYDAMRDAEEFGMIREWTGNQLPSMDPGHREGLLVKFQEDGSSLLRTGKSAEAQPLLEFVGEAIERDPMLAPELVEYLRPRNLRKRAQVLQALGHFSAAQELLETLVRMPEAPDLGNALADLGLIRGGFRSLAAILPPRAPGAAAPIRDALQRGRTDFEAAVQAHPGDAPNAHFCLGMLHLLHPHTMPDEASDAFRNALSQMLRKKALYEDAGLLEWARFGMACSLLEKAEPAELQVAKERLSQVMEGAVCFPAWLWLRVLRAVSIFDDEAFLHGLAKRLLETDQISMRALQDDHLHTLPGIRHSYFDWLLTQSLPADKQWDLLQSLLGKDPSPAGIELDREILDALEGLSVSDHRCRTHMKTLLQSGTLFEPAWSARSADLVRVRLHEVDGEFELAAPLLERRFYHLRDGGQPHELFEARQIAQQIHEYRLPNDVSPRLFACIEALETPMEERNAAEEQLRAGLPVSIFYVGGNEIQAAYETEIRRRLAECYPDLKVEFYFPGWDSSWKTHLDRVKPKVLRADGVVLNCLVRTQFGEHLRKFCGSDHPWLTCTGRGRKSLISSIQRAAIWAVERQKNDSTTDK